MNLKQKIEYFESDMSGRDENVSDFITPLHRVVWKFDINLPPPVFCGKGINFLVTAGIVSFVVMIIQILFNADEIQKGILIALAGGGIAGIYDIILNTKRSKRLNLGRWEKYPSLSSNRSDPVDAANASDAASVDRNQSARIR